jgi:signal transduction histidine kinase
LYNIAKHDRASNTRTSMGCERERAIVEVSDAGAGFDADEEFPGYLGLRPVRQRALRLGGTLETKAAPGRGTRSHARVSLHPRS